MKWSYYKVRKRVKKTIRVSEDCVPVLNTLSDKMVQKVFDFVNKNGNYIPVFNAMAVNHILEILGEKK